MYEKYMKYFYTDRLTIVRYKTVTNLDGTSGQEIDDAQELHDIPCHIVVLKEDQRNMVNTDVDDVEARFKLFVSPNVTIRKSDKLTVDKYLGKTKVQSYMGKASDPVFYDLAQEIILLEKRVKSNV